MLKDCMEIFQEYAKEKGMTPEDLILETYAPAAGYYVFVNENKILKRYHIDYQYNEETKERNFHATDESGGELNRGTKEWKVLCYCDYHSRILSPNKAIDPSNGKTILSNNYLSFTCRWEKVNTVDERLIDIYFNGIKKLLSDSNEIPVYGRINPLDDEKLENNRKWVKENFHDIVKTIKEEKDKQKSKQKKTKKENEGKNTASERSEYVKIYFVPDKLEKLEINQLKQFENEDLRFLNKRLFGNSKFNFIKGETEFGISSDNFTLADHKPFFKNRTKIFLLPQVLSFQDALDQKYFFDFLYNETNYFKGCKAAFYFDLNNKEIHIQKLSDPLEISFNGIYLMVNKGLTEAEILDYDIITDYNPLLKNSFSYDPELEISEKTDVYNPYIEYASRKDLAAIIDSVIFKGKLRSNFFTDCNSVCKGDKLLQRSILSAREAVYSWLYKGIDPGVGPILHNICLKNIKNEILNGQIFGTSGAIRQFNMMIALDKFLGGKDMGNKFKKIHDDLREKMTNGGDIRIESDDEYYYAVGQLTSYFISLNKSKKKMHSLANPVLNATTDYVIDTQMNTMFLKYDYAISTSNYAFNRLYHMVIDYKKDDPETPVLQPCIRAGYISDCLVWDVLKIKSKDKNTENNGLDKEDM